MNKTVKILLIVAASLTGAWLAWYLLSKAFPSIAGPGTSGGNASAATASVVQSAINAVIAANAGHTTYWKETTLEAAQQQVFADAVKAWGITGNVGNYSQYSYNGIQWGANGKGGTTTSTSSSGGGIGTDLGALANLATLAF